MISNIILPSLQYLRIGDPGVSHVCVHSTAAMPSRALRERTESLHYSCNRNTYCIFKITPLVVMQYPTKANNKFKTVILLNLVVALQVFDSVVAVVVAAVVLRAKDFYSLGFLWFKESTIHKNKTHAQYEILYFL